MGLLMSDFETRYRALNQAQKQAVDITEGPVMVVAGPGTGKTELLSMRVAQILRKTDVLAQNILCLTYTESGAYAMRERLAGLIGPEAYKVAIHTFHSFGTELINRNPEYFYQGAYFRPADELTSYEVLRELFERLPHDNPLATKMNNEFTYLRDTQTALSDLKKSGLTSDELLEILDRNDRFTTWLQPRLTAVFSDRVSKKTLSAIDSLLDDIQSYEEQPYELITYEPLHRLVHSSLELALAEATAENSTKPISAWKKQWTEKRDDGELTLKDEKRSKRLRAVASVYYEYLLAMQKRSLFDFDDMILRTVHALEVFDDLRLNMQEQFQYVMVDEFQDTNDAQMRLLWNLTNNPSQEGRPNIMVVGDDDQAIYRFQGATLSNILEYRHLYRDVQIITLRDNYRSSADILSVARETITQADERLEKTIDTLDKTLTPHYEPESTNVSFSRFYDEPSEYTALAQAIATERETQPDRSIAVIARHHRQLQALLPYLQSRNIPLSYDRRDNVLDTAPVRFLELLSRTITFLAEQRLDDVNGLLPELLAHPAWNIPPNELWQLSLESYRQRQFWLETMLAREGQLSDIAQWLILSAHISLHEPLEYILDHLTGTIEAQAPDAGNDEQTEPTEESTQEGFRSPLRDYFFSHELLAQNPAIYIAYLDALSSIRRKIRDYHPENTLLLRDFVQCIDKYRELGLTIQSSGHIRADHAPVELLTAHKSKGLEYDSVYIVGLADPVWGQASRSRGKLISYPHNLPIGISGDSSDEHIRLLFVALTRAKSHLILSTPHHNGTGKPILPVAYLQHLEPKEEAETGNTLVQAQAQWHAGLTAISNHTMAELLKETLASYKLSATHLCNFLDVSRGGPELFLLQNLLRFPQAMSPSAAFGSAVHATLQRAHAHLTATGKRRPMEDLLGDFETALFEYQLAHDQHEYYAKKGSDTLSAFFASRYDSFSPQQRVEQRFGGDGLQVGEARLSGAIDLIDIDEETKTITVTDYKTGKPTASWSGKTEYEKIKLHHYRQQLMFYKLLIEHSRQYAGYTVTHGFIEYVEPDARGKIHRLELLYDEDELRSFETLIGAVWNRIQALDFSLSQEYESSLKGIRSFESELENAPVVPAY
jgi:DNA helicase-2/ATP-dependent DNA helicase PcrA